MNRYGVFIAIVISLLFLMSTAHATTWYVHPDSVLNSIQAALNSCSTDDTVLVGPGIYYENISWPFTQGIDLVSEYGRDTTIIDGNSAGIAIAIEIGVDSSTQINGFTICNGYSVDNGGGIYCEGNSSPTIKNNTITDNASDLGGAGIQCYLSSSPIITSNIITNNSAGYGGGIFCLFYCSPFITNNTITFNTASVSGAGITCGYYCSPTISYNIISENTADSTGAGIACGYYSSPTITGNTISTNTTVFGRNGGIGCLEYSSPTIDSCTISNNIGDGIGCRSGSNPVINYCNITNNSRYGVQNLDSTLVVNAKNNWWGDPTGPYHPGTNPGGLGDSVSDYVDYNPWLGAPIGIYEYKATPKVTLELKNKPNPFRNRTIIYYSLTKPGIISLKVYDQTGRLVKTLENGIKRAGNYTVGWNGCNNTNQKVPAGVYFIRLKSGDFTSVKKIILVR
ncbi:right-handed parallel beta-helix repeat-containing protein [candidate division WOR-3 bacterium]|nr:right-handed parallel beta-helix repeat-containing protein [candidate division WOR-3 bacterium]